MGATNVATIYGQIELDNKGFKSTLLQSKSEMAQAALEMHKASRIKIDLAEYKKLTNQLHALKGRAQETRTALLKTAAGTDEAKKLEAELRGLTKRMSLLKAQTEPARKEMERLARAEKALGDNKGAGGGASIRSQIGGVIQDRLPGNLGNMTAGLGGLAGANPYAAAAAAAITAFTAISAAAIAAANSVGTYADTINDLAQSTALTTTQLQQLKFVAESGGDSFEGITKGAEMLVKKLPSFVDASGRTIGALRDIGVSATDSQGQMRNMSEVFPEVIRKLQQMTDTTERNALAAQIFGRGWTSLAPILGMTNAEFDAAIQKAHDLGLVLTGEQLAAAEKYKQQVDTLRLAWEGFVREVGSEVIPILTQLIQLLLNNWTEIKAGIKSVVDLLEDAHPRLKLLADSLRLAYDLAVKLGAIDPTPNTPDQPEPPTAGGGVTDDDFDAADAAAAKVAELNRQLALNGDTSQRAAMEYELLNGQLSKVDAATKQQLISLAAQVDAQNEAKEAAKEHADEQKRLADEVQRAEEKAAREAEAAAAHRVQKLNEQLNALRQWARDMAQQMRGFADDSLSIIKDQLQAEADARDAAASKARAQYSKLAQIGNAGARSMSGITMFAQKARERVELTPGDLTNERIQAAAAQVRAQRGNEAAVNNRIQGALFSDSIQRYEAAALPPQGMDLYGQSAQRQEQYLERLVALTVQNIKAVEGINPKVRL